MLKSIHHIEVVQNEAWPIPVSFGSHDRTASLVGSAGLPRYSQEIQ
jgi:hypothetical protein